MRDPHEHDWRTKLGRAEGRAAQDQLSDTVATFRLLLRLVTLPLWLPFWLWRRWRARGKNGDPSPLQG